MFSACYKLFRNLPGHHAHLSLFMALHGLKCRNAALNIVFKAINLLPSLQSVVFISTSIVYNKSLQKDLLLVVSFELSGFDLLVGLNKMVA